MIGELARQRIAPRARMVLSVVLGSAVLALVPGLSAEAGPTDPLTISDASVAEGGNVVFTISVGNGATGPVTGTYTVTNGTAKSGSDCTITHADYDDVTGTPTFSIPLGQSSTTVSVTTCGDTLAEPNETFTVTINPTSVVGASCTTTGGDCTATGTILNNDGPPAVLSIADATVTEGTNPNITFNLTLDKAAGQPVDVNYSTTHGTTTNDDFSPAGSPSGTVTFAENETTKAISLAVNDDSTAEASETFTLTITEATNVSTPDTEATGTIHDNDGLPVLSVSNDATDEGTEGTGTCAGSDPTSEAQCVIFTVSLSTAAGATVTVDYNTANGTATASQDFVPQSGTLTFAAGTINQQFVKVPVKGDTVTEGDETFSLVLSNAQNASCTGTGAKCTGVGSILEGAIPITVGDKAITEGSAVRTVQVDINLATAPGADPVVVHYRTADGTAKAGVDYEPADPNASTTFTAGQRTKTVEFDVYPDTLDEDAETFSVIAEGEEGQTICVVNAPAAQDCTGVVTINDDPADGPPALSINSPAAVAEGNADTTTVTFTVTLSAASGKDVAVTATTADQTATGGGECGTGIDYVTKSETKTFVPGDTSETFVVTVCGDTLAEANETFLVNLSSASNATIANGQGTGTISNDDGPAPALSVNDVTSTEANSGTKTFTFTVTLAQTSGKEVTVNYATSPDTASASVVGGSCGGTIDYVSKTGSLTFTPGDTSEPIAVTLCGDTRDENDETFFVTLSNPQNATLGDPSGTGTVTNDDGPPFVGVFDAEADENGGPLVFDVELSAASGKTVTVNVTTENGTAVAPGDYTAKAQTLTFTPGQVSKTFTVTVKDDAVVEDDEEMAVTLLDATNAVIDPDFETAVGFIFDDDEEVVEQGYALVDITGEVYPFGTADHFGSMAGQRLNGPMIGIALTSTGKGYWLVARDGGIFSFGDARFFGSMGNARLNAPVLGMEPTPTGKGYWLFAADGGIFSFGDAVFHGSMGDQRLNQPVVGMAATTTGKGYWLVASDGGIFAFGDAVFRGSMGNQRLNEPVFDMAGTADNGGYWLVARDGGIFAIGSARFHGSLGGVEIATVVGMDRTPEGGGYWIVDVEGFVYEFGDAEHQGDVGGELPVPIVGFGAIYPKD